MTHLGYMTKLFPSSPPHSSSSLFIVPKTATLHHAGFVMDFTGLSHFISYASATSSPPPPCRLPLVVLLVNAPIITHRSVNVRYACFNDGGIYWSEVIPQSLLYSALLQRHVQLTIHLLIVPKHCSSHHRHHSILDKHLQMHNRSSSSPFF
ncbi:hypothetical protein BT96DRAFT_988509 [Gymnopus androsaceus JB14]|uniref:Uncharacterized protein n=1 Tax=Gymnopus androsaceus JB14 TaxID=1447944 RepID=A0A6A4I9J7_9AGAR|nr:hypothetical protein BT96DRAFT_988509 [Gymnopus androsaceus JB14]